MVDVIVLSSLTPELVTSEAVGPCSDRRARGASSLTRI